MASNTKTKRFVREGKGFYDCSKKNNKVSVRLQRTAQGQAMIVGTYNLLERKWENETPKNGVPKSMKKQIEEFFS